MNLFKRAQRRYILYRYAIPQPLWASATCAMTVLDGLSSVEMAHLRELASVFLAEKTLTGVDLTITPDMHIRIAALACLPVLHLGIDLFSAWRQLLIYPAAFLVNRNETDAGGVVHPRQNILSGEAWLHGPVILCWADICEDAELPLQGHNVLIHEIAHKLDMLNGCANGMPPLHTAMPIADWTAAFSTAYTQLLHSIAHQHKPAINSYAATNPAEFFAVCSEYFFSAPAVLQQHYPAVYQQLSLYYRQNPLERQQPG